MALAPERLNRSTLYTIIRQIWTYSDIGWICIIWDRHLTYKFTMKKHKKAGLARPFFITTCYFLGGLLLLRPPGVLPGLEFQKKACLSGYKKEYGYLKLPLLDRHPGSISIKTNKQIQY